MQRKLKLILAPIILIATIAAFVRYLTTHPQLIEQLGRTSPAAVALLVILYLCWFGTLVLILVASMHFYHKTMPLQENFLLNAYSSLINFFGPGQSGPAVRGAYLYKRHQVSIKKFMFTTLLYYACYAVISALFLFGGSQPWWQTATLVAAVAGACFIVVRRNAGRGSVHISPRIFMMIALVTLLQALLQATIYFVELRDIDPTVSIAQALSYTGAANFALFVALTPGAIGIRESFLLFTQQLHGIGSQTIIAANVVDRGAYLLLLGVLFVCVISLHAKDKFNFGKVSRENSQDENPATPPK